MICDDCTNKQHTLCRGGTWCDCGHREGVTFMNIYCDNYSVCNSYLTDGITEERARVKGWHMFHGTDQGGKEHKAVLCPRCVDAKRRALDPAPPLQPGDQELFVIQVQIEEAP